MDIIKKLHKNPRDIYLEASRLLTKIAENILKEPANQRLRTLQKSNKNIANKILNVFGGSECLKLLGFVDETNAMLVLPPNASLTKLRDVKDDLVKYEKIYIENNGTIPEFEMSTADGSNRTQGLIPRIELPPYPRKYSNEFLHNVGYRFHMAQLHGNKYLQNRAKTFIPLEQLEIKAQQKLRALQKELKTQAQDEPKDFDMTMQEFLLLELLNWFKNDFFSWVDSPPCENCEGVTKFSHMCRDTTLLKYTDGVELHRCDICGNLTPFPRYNDLNILMESRKGRCGEWANCFTLFCRAMGWDARQVFDEGDHVWTEVYSFGEKRWLHCDPCENVCDKPLMYEAGWHKYITYVMAYSNEEVQDVTWRYTSNHKEILKRRVKCTEDQLLKVIKELKADRQSTLSECRRKYLAKRVVEELSEFLMEKQPTDADKKGRSSGTLAWRIARGEEQHYISNFRPCIWKFFDDDLQENVVRIRYSTALDKYEMFSGKNKYFTLDEWHKGLYQVQNIFRKEEKDWKKVYLARAEDKPYGKIKWTFDVNSFEKVFDVVDIKLDHEIFENGKVEIKAIGDLQEIRFLPNEKHLKSQLLAGSSRIDIIATLTGGKGDVAWQHAQLFRQAIDSEEFGFEVTFTFRTL